MQAVNLLLKRNEKMALEKAAAEKEVAEKAAGAKKAADEKAEAEKVAAAKAEKEKAEKEKAAAATEARVHELEKQLAATLATAKAMAEASWWPWKGAAETPTAPEKAPEKAPPSERLTSERARALDPMGAAELFWKTRYRFSVPHAITEQTTNYVKGIVRSRLPTGVPFEDVYPKVVISYASGRRPQDCEGAGPGMFYAADLLEFLHERRVPAFSGLHVPPGKDWKVFMLRLEIAFLIACLLPS
jgi:hypothetical protein